MRCITRSLLAVLLFATVATAAAAQEPIRMARTPDISPDGKLVAFSYLGDIWVVEAIGGVARPVTTHRAHDVYPVFSPDGRYLAFSSNRHGSYNVYVIPVQSGKPRRLTFDSGNDYVTGWSPDGKSVLFQSTRSTAFPPGFELYTVPAEGGMTRRVSAAEGKEGIFSPDGTRIAYVRGPGAWYRKGYRGSSNDDIWISRADGTDNRQLTSFNGQDGSPMWGADGQFLYYVSEFHGTPANVVRLPVDAPSGDKVKPQQLTFHKEDGVRRARISRDGCWIVYECGADLWVVGTKEGSVPRKLAIEVNTDDKSNTERMETFTSGATEYALAPDEKHVAFVVHGELFMMPVQSNAKATRLTHSTASNHSAAWAPDNSRLLYISDQSGHDNIWALTSDDPAKPKIVDAQKFKTAQLTRTKEAASGLSFAPDGKRVAFLQGGKLLTMNPDGGDPKEVVPTTRVLDYEWSPDSKWIVYSRMDGTFASELYVIPSGGATAENPARNITRYATYNSDVTWSADGKKIAFLSSRRGSAAPTLHVVSLQKPNAPGVAASGSAAVEFDWEDMHLRAEQVTPVPVEEAAISPDGSRIAFRATNNRQTDLWVVNADGSQLTRLTTGNQRPTQLQWTKRKGLAGYLDVVYFRDGSGSYRFVRASTPPSSATGGSGEARAHDNSATLGFKVKMSIRAEDEYSEMFDQSWRYLAENFYDKTFHGQDWDAVRARYRPLVKHVAMKEDLYALLYLMMGELNASHLGVTSELSKPEEMTADLGLIFDESYRGKGLKIQEVLKRGPADRRGLNLKPGEFIVAIDGEEITDQTDLSKLLNGKENETVTLMVSSLPDADPKDPKARRRVDVQATSRQQVSKLMYDRWVANNARKVAELSKGKLGYIHIPSMDEQGLDAFVRSLYSDNFDKEAIVLDVRFNGGGFTHDQVLNYLGAREHTHFRQRDGGEGPVLRSFDRKWTKPLVLLINNRSYSDAEIFPNAFRTLNLGKIVGEPTGGFVIGTAGVRLIDGSQFRIPRIGVYTTKGVNMEKEGVTPDVLVNPHPDQLAKGIDAQLEKAVEVLQKDVVDWKKNLAAKEATAPAVPMSPMPVTTPK